MLPFIVVGASMMLASLYWMLRTAGATRVAGRRPTPVAARRGTVIVIAVLVPTTTIALYAGLGRFDALTPSMDPVRAMATERTERLANRVETRGGDVAGLRLLARSYEQLSRFQEAVGIRRRLVALDADDPDAMVDLAEVIASTQGRSNVGEPIELARHALRIDASNARALALVANEAALRNDLPTAIDAWERVLGTVDERTEVARSLRANIAQAKSALVEASMKAANASSMSTKTR